jgi:hypothetical protein
MLDVGGWHFRPSADGRSTHASYLFAIDIGGQVPQWIVNAGVSAQALTIAVVRKVGGILRRTFILCPFPMRLK